MAVAVLHVPPGRNELAITIVAILGNVVSGLVFLAPLPTFYRICRNKSTESFEAIPYIVALFSATLWLYYGIVKTGELYLVTINTIGVAIEAAYVCIYLVHATNNTRTHAAKLFAPVLLLFTVIFITVQFILNDISTRVELLGYSCAIISIAVFAAPLSVMAKVIKEKSVEFMPCHLSLALTFSSVIWFFYGLLRRDLFVAVPNIFGFILGILQMVLYTVCRCSSKNQGSQA